MEVVKEDAALGHDLLILMIYMPKNDQDPGCIMVIMNV